MIIAKVLLVDDDPSIRKIGELTLKAVGKWEVILAASGTEALELAHRHAPDLILLDVVMPDMDGPAMLRRLRADPRTASIPIVFMTAKTRPEEVHGYLALGAVGVIPKPFDPMLLPGQIIDVLGTRRAGADVDFPVMKKS